MIKPKEKSIFCIYHKYLQQEQMVFEYNKLPLRQDEILY
jgi:hypothetical protein